MVFLLLTGCARVCGTSEYLTAGTAQALYDADGDGYAELQEQCGVLFDSFALRTATDTTFTFVPSLSGGKEDWDVTLYLLPASQVTVPTDALVRGATVTSTTGIGSHKVDGEIDTVIQNSALRDAELTFLGRRSGGSSVVDELANTEDWRVAWAATFIDPQSGVELQRIAGEDWIEVSDE